MSLRDEFHEDLWNKALAHVACNMPSPIDGLSPASVDRWVEEKYQELVEERILDRETDAMDRAKDRRKYGA